MPAKSQHLRKASAESQGDLECYQNEWIFFIYINFFVFISIFIAFLNHFADFF